MATGLFTGGVGNAGAYYGMNYGFQGLGILMDRAVVNSNGKAQKEADQLEIQYLLPKEHYNVDSVEFRKAKDTLSHRN